MIVTVVKSNSIYGDLDMLSGVISLPVQVRVRSEKFLGHFLLFFGLFFLFVIPYNLAWRTELLTLRSGSDSTVATVGGVLLILVFALPLLLAAVHIYVWRAHYDFTEDAVTRKKVGVFGTRTWNEQLSSYAGVRLARERHSGTRGGKRNRRYYKFTQHSLSLEHRTNKRRTVRIYSSCSTDDVKAKGLKMYCSPAAEEAETKHQQYAQLFNLPALGIET